MEYQIDVTFASPSRSSEFTLSHCVGEDDLTCLNYWDDLSEFMAFMISSAEIKLRKKFPKGHDFSLSNVNIKLIGDVEE